MSRIGFVLLLAALLSSPATLAHTPIVDSDLEDWCVGAFSNTAAGGGRVENSSATLTCGNCSGPLETGLACEMDSDCPTSTCVNLTSKTEIVWWDDRTDGAVNDLGTVVITTDGTNLYVGAELWVDPDPVSLPFGEIAIDYKPGGNNFWWDPFARLKQAGHCSGFTDRACTGTINNPANPDPFDDTNMDGIGDADCHFCQISTEPFPSTRKRTCGSACDPDIGDVCDTSQTCVFASAPAPSVGVFSSPETLPDALLVFDFSRWLIGVGDPDATEVRIAVDDIDICAPAPSPCWIAGGRYQPAVNPGASGGSGGPPGSVEIAIPLGELPGFDPNDFRFTMLIARGTLTLDYTPDGAIEDILSEAVAGTTTTTTNDCPGFGIGITTCELADGSTDAFVPGAPASPGGRTNALRINKGSVVRGDAEITLDWNPSCSGEDDNYSIYEGTIGDFTSHAQLAGFCAIGNLTNATIIPSAASSYYLVVPHDSTSEGSYGVDSSSAERDPSTAPCRSQSLGNCP